MRLPGIAYGLLLLVAALDAGGGTAVAQAPSGLLACAPAAEVITTDVRIPHKAAGAQFRVLASLEDFTDAEVTGLAAQLDDGSDPVAIPTPGAGTISGAALAFPPRAGRYTVSITWSQSANPPFSDACLGLDRTVVRVGPSAPQVRRFLRKSARAQKAWLQHRRKASRIVDAFGAAVPDTGSDSAILAALHLAARSAQRKVRGLRAISRRYSALVGAASPPYGLIAVNVRLQGTAMRSDRGAAAFFAALARAQTLADITNAKRALTRNTSSWDRHRDTWRKAVTKAAKDAGVGVPRWVTRVGKTTGEP